MRIWRKGLLAPIIALLAVIALSTLLIGHWIGVASLRRALEAREEDQLSGIHSTIKAIIDTEVARLSSLSDLLQKNPVLAEALAMGGDVGAARLQVILDDLHRGMGVDILMVTDDRGRTVYSLGKGQERVDLSDLWGMDEALNGQEVVSTDHEERGFAIRAISPLYWGKTVKGTIIVGNLIDDRFARQLAGETGNHILFATVAEVIASSVPAEKIRELDKELVKQSLLDKKLTFAFNQEARRLRLYAPLTVVDNLFCLVAESDVSRMVLLLERSRWQMFWVSAVVLLLVTAVGSFVAVRLTRPLRGLRQKAEGVIREYSPQTSVAVSRGNEVETLVRAFDAMVKAMREHIAAREMANEQLEKARSELDERVRQRTAELSEANEQLSRAKRLAEVANRAKSEFLATMSHELRTPLHQIIGFTELVANGPDSALGEEERRYLTISLQSSHHLLSLIEDILEIAKIEAGKLNLQLSEVDLVSLLEKSLEMIQDESLKKNLDMSLSFAGIPDKIVADERILRQILSHLLGNAVKFTGDGGSIQLQVKSIPWVDGQLLTSEGKRIDLEQTAGWGKRMGVGFIEVTVADTGVGIGEEDLERIFNPFEQVDSSFTRRFEGTGLGLALTREFVELHGGRIWAESKGLGKGSRFRFVIPVAQPSRNESRIPVLSF